MHSLYRLVKALRISRPSLKVLVSGPLIAVDARPIQLLGVDAIAESFEQAETMLDQLLHLSDNAELRTIG